jgi:hypothetical protein
VTWLKPRGLDPWRRSFPLRHHRLDFPFSG